MARRSRGGSNIGFIVVFAALVMLVLAIVGVCIDWVNTTVSVIGYSESSSSTFKELFDLFDGVEGDAASAFRLMASFAILTVILAAATTVLTGICKVLHWKLFRFILVIVAIVCVICGVVTIITGFNFCDKLGSFSLGSFASGETVPAAGMWLTAIGGILGGLIGVGAAVKN